jgi:hypothetical protein
LANMIRPLRKMDFCITFSFYYPLNMLDIYQGDDAKDNLT